VFLSILMIQKPPAEALSHWFGRTILWEVLGAALVGALMGYCAGRLLDWAEDKHTIENRSFIGYTIALSVAVLGAAKLMGTDGILAVFVAGLIFSAVVRGKERAEEENVQEAINRFLPSTGFCD
jgi:NhaP-type Na+/H+ or K+/H+ antiporter